MNKAGHLHACKRRMALLFLQCEVEVIMARPGLAKKPEKARRALALDEIAEVSQHDLDDVKREYGKGKKYSQLVHVLGPGLVPELGDLSSSLYVP